MTKFSLKKLHFPQYFNNFPQLSIPSSIQKHHQRQKTRVFKKDMSSAIFPIKILVFPFLFKGAAAYCVNNHKIFLLLSPKLHHPSTFIPLSSSSSSTFEFYPSILINRALFFRSLKISCFYFFPFSIFWYFDYHFVSCFSICECRVQCRKCEEGWKTLFWLNENIFQGGWFKGTRHTSHDI